MAPLGTFHGRSGHRATSPFRFDVTAGKKYLVRLRPQPEAAVLRRLAQGTGITPVQYDATETKTVFFCGCKHTNGKPFCDGTDAKLP